MRDRFKTMCLVGWVCLNVTGVWAHHAMEYIETESYTTPRKGEKLVYVRYDYLSDDKNDADLDHWEWTPGFSLGLHDRVMLDLHTHYAKFGTGHLTDKGEQRMDGREPAPFFEAVAMSLQYRVTQGAWLDVAVAARVEVPFERARDLLDSQEVYEAVLILSKPFAEHANVTLNLIAGWEGSDDYLEFALGVKTPISADPHGIAAGIEFLGELDDIDKSWSILPGLYMPLGGADTIMKVGAEIGKDAHATKISVSLMRQF